MAYSCTMEGGENRDKAFRLIDGCLLLSEIGSKDFYMKYVTTMEEETNEKEIIDGHG
jgi:hypothetical protein